MISIIITQWALDAYLDLKHRNVFLMNEYWTTIRPDVLLLKHYPADPKFNNGKFWSIASDPNDKSKKLQNGYKMKWHQIGNGKVQLRLTVAYAGGMFLCESYEKIDDKQEKRKLARFKTYVQLIQKGRYITRGVLL